MTIIRYIQGKMIFILLNIIFDVSFGMLLLLYGCELSLVVMIWIFRMFVIGIYLGLQFYKLRVREKKCNMLIKTLDQSYMISEVLDRPDNIEEEIYYEMLKTACKSMNDVAAEYRRRQTAYKEYVEGWIHEIKNPVAAVKLLCFNHQNEVIKEIGIELEAIDNLLTQVLYYARSESVEQDYFIREFELSDVVKTALLQYRNILLRYGFRIEDMTSNVCIRSDEKWICFILSQLISNAIKYRNEIQPVLKFEAEKTEKYIRLIVEDNGCGISQTDLPRIFERGFTGSNRKKSFATGMGLYLCKKLCDKMGLVISAESEHYIYTRIIITFSYGQLTEL